MPDSSPLGVVWARWFDGQQRPLVLVFAASWESTPAPTLDAIRAELRDLGAAMLVATQNALFCLSPDSANDEPIPGRLREPGALDALYRRYGIRPAEVQGEALILTLLDDDGHVCMQSSREASDGVESAVLETLRWAGTSAAFGSRVLFSRREAVMLSLIGAVALSAASPRPDSRPPPRPASPRLPTSQLL